MTRPTVYSHFPDELSLGKACSSLELSDNPLPDPGPWQEIADPERRLRLALGELYAYFRRRERLWTNILRDQEMALTNDDPEAHEADAEIMEQIFLHWERMKQSLATGWGASDESSRLPLSAIGLALDFQTWRAMGALRRRGRVPVLRKPYSGCNGARYSPDDPRRAPGRRRPAHGAFPPRSGPPPGYIRSADVRGPRRARRL